MAKHVITVLTDDLDGGDADRTLEFGSDGVDYTIDLSEKNAGPRTPALPWPQVQPRSPRSGARPASGHPGNVPDVLVAVRPRSRYGPSRRAGGRDARRRGAVLWPAPSWSSATGSKHVCMSVVHLQTRGDDLEVWASAASA